MSASGCHGSLRSVLLIERRSHPDHQSITSLLLISERNSRRPCIMHHVIPSRSQPDWILLTLRLHCLEQKVYNDKMKELASPQWRIYEGGRRSLGILKPQNQKVHILSEGQVSYILTALWAKLVLKGSILMVYNCVNEVFTEVSGYVAVAATLLGAECINDKKNKVAYVLATASVNCAPTFMLSSSRPCFLRFVSSSDEHNDYNKRCPRIVIKCV